MTTVELVSNAAPEVSTHEWAVVGLDQLTRQNKLSSLPFWVPNGTVKTHQFRLVMLRGLVPSTLPEDDSFGLLLELVPPPTAEDGKDVSTMYPGGCSVTARVVNEAHKSERDHGSYDVVSTQAVMISESNLQVSFPELITATVARNSEFVTGDPATLTVRVTIRTGVNVVAQQVTRSVASFWSALTSSVSQLVERADQVYHEVREEFTMDQAAGSAAAHPTEASADAVAARPPPWEVVPAKWAGREAAWHHLVFEHMVEDEGTFLHGPERGLSSEERGLLLQAGLNQKCIAQCYDDFDYDRDLSERLLDCPALRQQRYHLVPARIKDLIFWKNYFWKAAAAAQCETDAQVVTLLTVLNSPPTPKSNLTSDAYVGLSDEEVLTHVRDAQEAVDLLQEYLNEGSGPASEDEVLLVDATVATCDGHIKQLEPLYRRTDLPEATLQLVGTVLRRLRDHIRRYHEVAAQWKDVKAAKEETAEAIQTPPRSPSPPALASTSPPQHPEAEKHSEEGGGAPPLMEVAPAPTQPVASSSATEEQAAVSPAKGETAAEKQGPASSSSNDAGQAAKETPESTAKEAAVTTASAPASRETSVEPLAGKVDFPKMPWEEEDD